MYFRFLSLLSLENTSGRSLDRLARNLNTPRDEITGQFIRRRGYSIDSSDRSLEEDDLADPFMLKSSVSIGSSMSLDKKSKSYLLYIIMLFSSLLRYLTDGY